MKKYDIYTDGAYSPSKNAGGIGFVILNPEGNKVCEFCKKYTNTTNQRMEQLAVAVALESIKTASDIRHRHLGQRAGSARDLPARLRAADRER